MKYSTLPCLLFLISAASAVETPAYHSTFSIMEENDKFGTKGTDRYYTQGMRLLLTTSEHTYLSLTQEINTPEDTANPNPALTDQPYSGALYLAYGYGKVFERGGRRDCMASVELKLGVIGPASGAETIQNKFHDLIDTPEAAGWGTQIPNEVAFNVDAEFRRRFELCSGERPISDLIARSVAQFGNLRSEFLLGTQLRLGHNLDKSWGHTFIRHSNGYNPGPGVDTSAGFSAWAFLDTQVEVVVRNFSLDGGNFRESRGVDRRPIVGQLALGGTFQAGFCTATVFMAWRTEEFETQAGMHAIGGFKGDFRF